MINTKEFYDTYFKFLTLLFWPMIWYKWVSAIPNPLIELTMFWIFFAFAAIYILLFVIYYIRNPKAERIIILYRLSLLVSFIFTLLSFLILPTSILGFYVKTIAVAICFYFSCIKLFRYQMEEGLVGMLSCALLIAITLLSYA